MAQAPTNGFEAVDLGGFFMGGLMGAIVMPAISNGVEARIRRDNSNYQYEISIDEIQNHDDKLHFFQMLESLAKKAKIKKFELKSHPIHLSSPERVRIFRQNENRNSRNTYDANHEPILVPIYENQLDDDGNIVNDEEGNPIIYHIDTAERWVSNKMFKLPKQGFRLKDSQGKKIRFKPLLNADNTLRGYSIQLSQIFCEAYYNSFMETLKPQPSVPEQNESQENATRDDRDNIELFWRVMKNKLNNDTTIHQGHMSSGEHFWEGVCATTKVVSYFLVAIAGIAGAAVACVFCWPAVVAGAVAGTIAFIGSIIGGIVWSIFSFAGWRTWFS